MVTDRLHRAAVKATTPVPQATSQTLSLASISANCASRGPAVPVQFSIMEKTDHTALALCFMRFQGVIGGSFARVPI